MSHLHAHDSPDLNDNIRFQIAVMVGIAARLTEDGHRVSYHEGSPAGNAVRTHVELNRRHSSIFFSCASNTLDEICATIMIPMASRSNSTRFKISDPDLYDKISEFAAKN